MKITWFLLLFLCACASSEKKVDKKDQEIPSGMYECEKEIYHYKISVVDEEKVLLILDDRFHKELRVVFDKKKCVKK